MRKKQLEEHIRCIEMPGIKSLHNYLKEYLDAGHGVSDIQREFGISTQTSDGLVIYKYSQEESPKTVPLVRQSRGIVLEEGTNEIVHYPFYRFFNYGEIPEEDRNFRWQNAVVSEKLDGSMIGIFHYRNRWHICTSSQIGAASLVTRAPFTYRELIDIATGGFDSFSEKLNPRFDYTFELISPFNRVITPYESTMLYLIGCRDRNGDFREIPFYEAYETDEIVPAAVRSTLHVPKIFSITDGSGRFKRIEDIAAKANSLGETDEGFVVIDFTSYDPVTGSFPRMKVKNQSYLAIKYLHTSEKENAVTVEDLFRVVLQAEESEFLTAMPEFGDMIQSIKSRWQAFCGAINETLNRDDIRPLLAVPAEKRASHMKPFVFALKDCPHNKFLFPMYKSGGSSLNDMLSNLQKRLGKERAVKTLCQTVLPQRLESIKK